MRAIDLCSEFAIEIVPVQVRRIGRQTHAGKVIERLIADYGAAHARLVLMTIAESTGNETELRSETIQAVSDVLWSRPDWERRGSRWLEAFDQLDLKAMRARAKRILKYPARKVLAVLIHIELERLFALQDAEQPAARMAA